MLSISKSLWDCHVKQTCYQMWMQKCREYLGLRAYINNILVFPLLWFRIHTIYAFRRWLNASINITTRCSSIFHGTAWIFKQNTQIKIVYNTYCYSYHYLMLFIGVITTLLHVRSPFQRQHKPTHIFHDSPNIFSVFVCVCSLMIKYILLSKFQTK